MQARTRAILEVEERDLAVLPDPVLIEIERDLPAVGGHDPHVVHE